jgi:hypothetical protein
MSKPTTNQIRVMTILPNKSGILELLLQESVMHNRNGNVKCGTTARQVTHTRGNVYVHIPATFISYIKPKHTTREPF